jgi:hypothetical protein
MKKPSGPFATNAVKKIFGNGGAIETKYNGSG